MSFSNQVKDELLHLRLWEVSNKKPDEQLKKLILRENFIKSGFISDPKQRNHLEILFKIHKKAEEARKSLLDFSVNSKIIQKGKTYMLYIKDGEEISNFLALVGANNSVIKFEEERVIKSTKNNINRIVNCETANMNKTIDTALEQIEDIRLIRRKMKFNELNEALQEIAIIREKNADGSLEELGKMLEKPIGKSGVNHRFKKIHKIADELREKT